MAALALTMGDPAGVGPEIALRAWLARDRVAVPPFLYIGDFDDLARRAEQCKINVPLAVSQPEQAVELFRASLPVWPVPLAAPSIPGTLNPAHAPAIVAAIDTAADLLQARRVSAMVTNPINKANLRSAGFAYSGHTDYLAQKTAATGDREQVVMMLASPELRVVPVTVHIPLMQVTSLLTQELICRSAMTVDKALRNFFGIDVPRIAVTGLNPHAGEQGMMGDEEQRIIIPAVTALQQRGMAISGPFAADSLFHQAARDGYDVVLAMYHDQALLPIKTIAFDRAVNISLGLPFIRTSPDHGTALTIAGSGTANASSLIEALIVAANMAASDAT